MTSPAASGIVSACDMMAAGTARREEKPAVSRSIDDIESDLIDLTEVTLADLPTYDERILAPTIRRLLRRIDDPESITSGYNPQRVD